MNIVDECSWNTGFQQRLKKKKDIAGRPRPKSSELNELILSYGFFDLENIISKSKIEFSLYSR